MKKESISYILKVTSPIDDTINIEKVFRDFPSCLNWAFKHTQGTCHLKVYMQIDTQSMHDYDLDECDCLVADICLWGLTEKGVVFFESV